MNETIKVLDHGFARLVSHMQPAVAQFGWSGDLEVVRNARVSYDADWRSGEDGGKDEKLLNYMLRNRHTSPFEGMVFTFEIKAPIFVMRQWHRHRTWSYNEVSARYTELPEEFYVPEIEQITTQSKSNKQMRTDVVNNEADYIQQAISEVCEEAFETYRNMLRRGCPRELARGVLPMNTYTRMFATVDLHNLLHFLDLRLHEHAQYEIRVYAEALLELIQPLVPTIHHAYKNRP
jgi:thymidylate synthase (FAD)